MKSIGRVIAIAVALLLVAGAVAFTRDRILSAERDTGLVADSLAASRDTTRRLELAKSVLGDSLQAVQRRALQVAQRADSLDVALGLERKAKVSAVLNFEAIRALNVTATKVLEDASDTRHASWRFVRSPLFPPFDSLVIDAHVPAPPAPAMIDIAIGFRPVAFAARLSCGAPDPAQHGVRSAEFTLALPTWMNAHIGEVQQDPDICNPKPARVRPWTQDPRTWLLVATSLVLIIGIR